MPQRWPYRGVQTNMLNQLFTGTPTSRRQVTLPSVIEAGDPILVGTDPAFALDSYQANVAGATCLFNGTFYADVLGASSVSPSVSAAIKRGAKLYAVGGTLDAATNVRYGFTLCADTTGIPFGTLDPSPQAGGPVVSGQTQNVGVKIDG